MMNRRKGIILAGGAGTRLHPSTISASKHLLHVYDKPMIYYSLSLLMLAGVREILVVSTPQDVSNYQRLLADGSQWGLSISYVIQEKPEGIAHAFILAEQFIGNDPVSLVLGDNLLYGDGLQHILTSAAAQDEGAVIFGYLVKDPRSYGILHFDTNGQVIDIEEKPEFPKSHYAVIGLYFYDNQVIDYAKSLKPSKRGELEITDINVQYLKNKNLTARLLGRGMAWLDAGTPASLLDAANFFHSLEARQGLKVYCPEEIAWRLHYINDEQLENLAHKLGRCDYGVYLSSLLKHHHIQFSSFNRQMIEL